VCDDATTPSSLTLAYGVRQSKLDTEQLNLSPAKFAQLLRSDLIELRKTRFTDSIRVTVVETAGGRFEITNALSIYPRIIQEQVLPELERQKEAAEERSAGS